MKRLSLSSLHSPSIDSETRGVRGPVLPACGRFAVVLALSLAMATLLRAALPPSDAGAPKDDELVTDTRATVTVDGEPLFKVRGTSLYPASQRADAIAQRIQGVAADLTVSTESLRWMESPEYTTLLAGDRFLMRVFDPDAKIEDLSRPVLAQIYLQRIGEAIDRFRYLRKPGILVRDTVLALFWTLAALGLGWLMLKMFSWVFPVLERRLAAYIETLQHKSQQVVQATPLIGLLRGGLRGIRVVLFLALGYAWVSVVFGLFPWTRPLSLQLSSLFLNPLRNIGQSFIEALPSLIFIGVLVVLTRYLLKLTRVLFGGLARGTIVWGNFDPDWAWPTYKIIRLLIVSFMVVVAYPYIPGSSSEAFKGMSLFLGVVFSLGSSSVISNLIAGYSLTYRRAFKIGDRVRIGEVFGDVSESGLVVTRIRSLKNEEVIVPNSTILSTEVINYTSLARQHGLILHTTVGIGYETPWRQVEMMLKLAADRTSGVLKDPAPFVVQKALGDFAVTYEINAYCNDPRQSLRIYTGLHQNILDLFNEYGVQIMTPAYEGDPPTPKVVPKDQWFAAPATKPK